MRRSIKKDIIRLIIVITIIILSFIITFKILYDRIDIKKNNETYINNLTRLSFGSYNLNDLLSLSSTEFLLKYSFGIENFNSGVLNNFSAPVIFEENEEEKSPSLEPLVYIFNTHQTEGYNTPNMEAFNINNTVFLASHILKEYLSDLGIGSIVEENSIVDILNTNGWKYGRSYQASRILLESAKKNNPSLNFFIDLHRDSASIDRTMIEINNIRYAKVMFVVGLEHENYEKNLKLAKYLNDKLKEVNPGLSRGVLEKKGPGVNGIYNQDISPNTILIEVGGQYNSIEEVNETLKIMAKIIYEYLKGPYEKEK